MQTLTIKIDESYLSQFMHYLHQIPKNKREIIGFKQPSPQKQDPFLDILANGPTYSPSEIAQWEKDIHEGYASWNIEEF